MIAWLLLVFATVTPIVISSLFQNAYWGILFTLVPVFALIALNDIAVDLENPFGKDANDLPLTEFQDHMNTALLMLIREETDHVPFVTEDSHTTYDKIKANINHYPPKHFLSAEVFRSISKLIPENGLNNTTPTPEEGQVLDIRSKVDKAPMDEGRQPAPPPPPPAASPSAESSFGAVFSTDSALPTGATSALPPAAQAPSREQNRITDTLRAHSRNPSSASDLEALQRSATALEQTLQRRFQELGQHFQSLMGTTDDLASNMGKHTEIMIKCCEVYRSGRPLEGTTNMDI